MIFSANYRYFVIINFQRFNTGAVSIAWQEEMIETKVFDDLNVFGPDGGLPPDLDFNFVPEPEPKGCFPFLRKKFKVKYYSNYFETILAIIFHWIGLHFYTLYMITSIQKKGAGTVNANIGKVAAGDTNTTSGAPVGTTLTTGVQNTTLDADQIASADKISKSNIAEGTSQNGKAGVSSAQNESTKDTTKSLKSGADEDTKNTQEEIKGVD